MRIMNHIRVSINHQNLINYNGWMRLYKEVVNQSNKLNPKCQREKKCRTHAKILVKKIKMKIRKIS